MSPRDRKQDARGGARVHRFGHRGEHSGLYPRIPPVLTVASIPPARTAFGSGRQRMRWVGRDESAGIVEPRKLLAVGYPFRFPELVAALRTDAEVDASLAAMRSSRIR